jgi:peptidoglycan/LPS O-acetylase OafA/YrhL
MAMRTFSIERVSGGMALAFSLIALLTIAIAYLQPAPPTPPTDEGTLAHIFQVSVALFVPALLLFVATADWRRPRRGAALVAVCVLALAVAFVGLYLGEHGYWYPLGS